MTIIKVIIAIITAAIIETITVAIIAPPVTHDCANETKSDKYEGLMRKTCIKNMHNMAKTRK